MNRGHSQLADAPPAVEIAPNHKFAVLAVPDSRAGGSPWTILPLPGGYAVSSALPTHAVETWATDIGRFHRKELEECTLFLWAVTPSAAADILNRENEQLSRSVLRLFVGLLLATPYYSCGRLTLLTGANVDGTARARSLTTYYRTWHTVGAPEADLTTTKLRLASRLALELDRHDRYRFKDRMTRAVRCFRDGCAAGQVDERLHQFVRCAEAFAAPRDGKQFAARLSRLCAGRNRRRLRAMYAIRSSIEHLQGPYARLPQSATKNERHILLLRRCVEAEALARYLLTAYLLDRRLWKHFRHRASVSAFWALSGAALRSTWPSRLGLDEVSRSFDLAAAQRRVSEADG